jgi:hypothetical protein
MRSNSKQVKDLIKLHILERVTDENSQEFTSFENCKKYILQRFKSEYNHPRNKQLYPNTQERFLNYCLGMPFDFTTWYDEMKTILNSWGLFKDSATNEQICKLYFYLIYREVNK